MCAVVSMLASCLFTKRGKVGGDRSLSMRQGDKRRLRRGWEHGSDLFVCENDVLDGVLAALEL